MKHVVLNIVRDKEKNKYHVNQPGEEPRKITGLTKWFPTIPLNRDYFRSLRHVDSLPGSKLKIHSFAAHKRSTQWQRLTQMNRQKIGKMHQAHQSRKQEGVVTLRLKKANFKPKLVKRH